MPGSYTETPVAACVAASTLCVCACSRGLGIGTALMDLAAKELASSLLLKARGTSQMHLCLHLALHGRATRQALSLLSSRSSSQLSAS